MKEKGRNLANERRSKEQGKWHTVELQRGGGYRVVDTRVKEGTRERSWIGIIGTAW